MERDIIRLECLKLAVANKGLYQVSDYIEAAKKFEGYIDAECFKETACIHANEPKRGRPKGSGKLRQEASSGISGTGVYGSGQEEKGFDVANGEGV